MALDPDQLVVTGSGRVYAGTVGVSTIPTNVSAAIDVAGTDGWVELGYTSEAGVSFSFGRDSKEIKGWQSRNPLRQVVTGTPSSFKCELLQWNHATLRLALGGGSITGSNPNFSVHPCPRRRSVTSVRSSWGLRRGLHLPVHLPQAERRYGRPQLRA